MNNTSSFKMTSSPVQLSIALVTRNRPASLERTLKSLRRQDVQPIEVIISDDSDEHDRKTVSTLARTYDCIYQRGPQRGLYANRNAVAKACRGTHIRTMDDDHEFPDNHLDQCLAAIARDPNVIWIFGERYPGQSLHEPAFCPGQLHPRGFSAVVTNPESSWAYACGAAIYPRRLIERGVFNAEYFRFGYSFFEFGSRLHWLGYRIRHLPSTYVLHHLNLENRSWPEDEEFLASRVFAMLCHSMIYQPSWQNRLLMSAEFAKVLLLTPRPGKNALRAGVHAYKLHRPIVERQKKAHLSAAHTAYDETICGLTRTNQHAID
jgi:glycosyltransferase involved in cell wall biosynthesis